MGHYIATNRQINEDGKTINPNGEIPGTESLRFAKYLGKHESQRYELLNDYPNKQWKMIDYADPAQLEAGSGLFFKMLYNDMKNSGKDTLFFIHGFANDLTETLNYIDDLEETYCSGDNSIGQIVMFSWPTNGPLIKEYANDQADAEFAAEAIYRLFRKLEKFLRQFLSAKNLPCKQKIHLMVQSMGNQVLEKTVQLLNRRFNKKVHLFSEILMIGADVDTDVFLPEKSLSRLPDYCERIHVYQHRRDRALLISKHTKNHAPRLGREGPVNILTLPKEFVIVDITKADNQTKIKDAVIHHWYFLYVKEVINDIRLVLQGCTLLELEKTDQTDRQFDIHENKWEII